MIQTNYVKCSDKDCNLVAWYKAIYEDYALEKNLCQKHYEQYKEILANWNITDIDYKSDIK